MILRLKMFSFYTCMAWMSLFKPNEGQKMIDSAVIGKDYQDRDAQVKAIFGNAQRKTRND